MSDTLRRQPHLKSSFFATRRASYDGTPSLHITICVWRWRKKQKLREFQRLPEFKFMPYQLNGMTGREKALFLLSQAIIYAQPPALSLAGWK